MYSTNINAARLTAEMEINLCVAQSGALCELSQNTLRTWLPQERKYVDKNPTAVADGEDVIYKIEHFDK